MKPVIDKHGALRGFMNKTYSEQLQEDLEPVDRMIDEGGPVYQDFTEGVSGSHLEDNKPDLESVDARQFVQAVADSMLPTRHPIYDCKFWIYEERRLAPYDEYMNFYRRLENGSNNKGQR